MTDLSAFSLEGQTILVTGANTGIGQGIALSLANAGAHIIGAGRSSMAETSRKIADKSGKFSEISCDFSQPDQVHSLIDKASAVTGALHGLINNAGIIRRADSVDLSETDWDEVLDINLKVPFLLAQSFGKRLLSEERPGKIVNVASLLSFQGGIRVASYTASKHGISGLTKILANEWAARNINVNAIAPGYIATNNTQALRDDPKRSAEILGRIPAGRWGVPSDIGDTAAFLCAPASNYLHGVTLPVDGGWLAR